jgi:peptidoglycan/LPS O-acetylase OafA/YrhL
MTVVRAGPGVSNSASREARILPGLDLVRFCAASLVMFYHFAYWSWHDGPHAIGLRSAIGTGVTYPSLVEASWFGWVGVEIFFVISGLVIAMSAEGRTPGQFLRSRFLRLAPGLWFFATVSLAVTLAYATASPADILRLYVKSILLVPKGPWLDGVYWTLTVEVLFYALMCVVLVTGRRASLDMICIVWLAVTLAFAVSSLAQYAFDLHGPIGKLVYAIRHAYLSRALLLSTGPFFILGLVLFLIHAKGITFTRAALAVAAFLAGEINIYLYGMERTTAVRDFNVWPYTACLAFALAVLAIVVSLRGGRHPVTQIGAWFARVARTLGLASYALYLVHYVTGAWILGCLLQAGLAPIAALFGACLFCVASSLYFATMIEPHIRAYLARRIDVSLGRFAARRPVPRLRVI